MLSHNVCARNFENLTNWLVVSLLLQESFFNTSATTFAKRKRSLRPAPVLKFAK